MRIGIISDAHLFNKYAITTEKYNEILKEMIKQDVDCIVDCGDLTDKSHLSAPQLDKLSKIFNNVNNVPIYIVAGNHDSLDNTTVASVFNMKKNITIITKPTKIDNMLFVPYTNNIKKLYEELEEVVDESVDYAFSHLNITNLFYADISFDNSQKLFTFADIWFNGHIHIPENYDDMLGSIYNVGSCSSLTFGDTHIPNYCIFSDDGLIRENIKGSIVHKIFKQNLNLEDLGNDFDYRCRIDLYNNPNSLELRKEIRDLSLTNPNIKELVFSYIKDETRKETLIKQQQASKISLSTQLIKQFETDNKITLSDDIKRRIIK